MGDIMGVGGDTSSIWTALETMVDGMRMLAQAQRFVSPDQLRVVISPDCTLVFARQGNETRLTVADPAVGLDVLITGPKQFRAVVQMAIRMCQVAHDPPHEASVPSPDLPSLLALHGEAIRQQYQQMSLTGLAGQYHVPVARMRAALVGLGITIRPAGHRPVRTPAPPSPRELEVLARFDRHESLEAIAAASGYSRENIRLIARRHGRQNRRDVARETQAALRDRIAVLLPTATHARDVAQAVSRSTAEVLPIIASIDPSWASRRLAEDRHQRQAQASAIATRARLAIEARNSSVGLVAVGLQVTGSVISQLLAGTRQSAALLERFAAHLDVPLSWLVHGHPVPPGLAEADLHRLESDRVALAGRIRLAVEHDPRRVEAIAGAVSWPVGRLRAILGQVASPRPYIEVLAQMLDVPIDWLLDGHGDVDWVARRSRLMTRFPHGLRSTAVANTATVAAEALPGVLERLRIWCYGRHGTLSQAAQLSGVFPRRFAAILNGRMRDDGALQAAMERLEAPQTWITSGLPGPDEQQLAPIIERGQHLVAGMQGSSTTGSDPPMSCVRRFYIMLAAHQLTPVTAAHQAQVDVERLQRVLQHPQPRDMHLLTQVARTCGVSALWIRRGLPDGDHWSHIRHAATTRGVDLDAFIAWIDQPEPAHATA